MAILELQNVSKVYQMGKITVNAVQDATFSINAGEFASVSGPSGSGKSTLLNLMGLIDLPTSGKIIVDGTDVYAGRNLAGLKSIPSSLDRHMTELRRLNLGFIFQNFNLIQVLNVRENVELPLKLGRLPQSRAMGVKEAAEWVDYLIETVGLTDWKNHKPTELSGGQRQRVAIARAMVHNPYVLLADEPTGNLDPKNAEEVFSIFKEINARGTTVVMATHNPDFYLNSPFRRLVLDHGELLNRDLI